MSYSSEIHSLFQQHNRDIERRIMSGAKRRRQLVASAPDLKSFGLQATALMNAALGLKRARFASWIPGLPVTALLSGKRRLTVDLTPTTLTDFRRWFGLSPEAFIAFAQAGVLVVNIRDFDPKGASAEQQADAYAMRDRALFLPQLFAKASRNIYFLSTLRDQLFDPLFGKRNESLRHAFAEADVLTIPARAADALDVLSMEMTQAVFRGERPNVTAARWHWAYATSMRRFLNQINPDIWPDIRRRYDALIRDKTDTAGADYLLLATQLRYAHLLASAPMSAAFGGVYNFLLDGEAQFLQAVRLGSALADYDYLTDHLLDLIHALQVGRLPRYLEIEVPARFRKPLAHFGVQVFVRYHHISHHDHYLDGDHQKQLIDYVLTDDGLDIRFDDIEKDIENFQENFQENSPKSIETLAQIAAEASVSIQSRGDSLRKITRMHQGIERPSPDLVTLPATPIFSTNPRDANLLMNLSKTLKDNNPSIGKRGDADRRTISFPKLFRRPPQ